MIVRSIRRVACGASLLCRCLRRGRASLGGSPGRRRPTASTIPPPLEEYLGRQIAQTMHYTGAEWLVRDVREREERCSVMLASLGVRAGQTVLDMGCGNGFYTLAPGQDGRSERPRAGGRHPARNAGHAAGPRPNRRVSRISRRSWVRSTIRVCPPTPWIWPCWSTCITSSPIRNRCWPPCDRRSSQRPAGAR